MRCWPPTSQSLGGSAERKHSTLGKCTFLQSRKKKKHLSPIVYPQLELMEKNAGNSGSLSGFGRRGNSCNPVKGCLWESEQLLALSRMPRNGEGACSLWSKPLGSGSELSTLCEASSFHGPPSVVLQTNYFLQNQKTGCFNFEQFFFGSYKDVPTQIQPEGVGSKEGSFKIMARAVPVNLRDASE